jgi:hypothetical protein
VAALQRSDPRGVYVETHDASTLAEFRRQGKTHVTKTDNCELDVGERSDIFHFDQ